MLLLSLLLQALHQALLKLDHHGLGAGQGWSQALEVENDRLRGELDGLRQRAVSTPQHDLRAANERLTFQLREVEKADKTRAQLGYEIADLKQQLDQLRRSQGKSGPANLRRQLKVPSLHFLLHQLSAATVCLGFASESLSSC